MSLASTSMLYAAFLEMILCDVVWRVVMQSMRCDAVLCGVAENSATPSLAAITTIN